MGAGHLAVGLACKAADRHVNAGFWILAGFASDLLLGIFLLAGWESVGGLEQYPNRHFLTYTFPYSHGLIATLVWSAVAAAVAWRVTGRRKPAAIAAGALISHFALDALVHVPELPVAGPGSRGIGLGLWTHLGWALGLEAALTVAGLLLYTRAAPDRTVPMAAAGVIAAAVLIGGQAMGGAPPPPAILATSWIVGPLLLAALVYRIDREGSKARAEATSCCD